MHTVDNEVAYLMVAGWMLLLACWIMNFMSWIMNNEAMLRQTLQVVCIAEMLAFPRLAAAFAPAASGRVWSTSSSSGLLEKSIASRTLSDRVSNR